MEIYQKVIDEIRSKYEQEPNVLGMFITGSVARNEAHQGNDLDILLVTKTSGDSIEYRMDNGALVEIGVSTQDEMLNDLASNAMKVYMYLDAKAIFDKENSLEILKEKANEIIKNYKPQEKDKKAIKKWLESVVDKVQASQNNKDNLKVGFHISNVLWKVTEGLYTINSVPTPASTSALRRATSLKILPQNFNNLWEDVLTGDLIKRTQATLELMKFIITHL